MLPGSFYHPELGDSPIWDLKGASYVILSFVRSFVRSFIHLQEQRFLPYRVDSVLKALVKNNFMKGECQKYVFLADQLTMKGPWKVIEEDS